MEFETSSQRATFTLNVPVAILIAGVLIAAAIFFKGAGFPTSPDGLRGAGTGQAPGTPAPAAGAPQQPSVGDFRPVSADDHIRGASDAKVTIIEYSDLECPFCKQFHATLQQAVQEYPNDVRWVYRHFPLVQLHSKAPAEANAAECAGEQGKFWEFIDIVFEVTPANDGLNLAQLPEYARQAGVANIVQFQDCVDSNKYKEKVDADVADAQAAGGRGTPYSVVVGPDGEAQPLSGAQPYATVKATVESLL